MKYLINVLNEPSLPESGSGPIDAESRSKHTNSLHVVKCHEGPLEVYLLLHGPRATDARTLKKKNGTISKKTTSQKLLTHWRNENPKN